MRHNFYNTPGEISYASAEWPVTYTDPNWQLGIDGSLLVSDVDTAQTRSPHEYVSLWICRRNQSQEKKLWEQQRRPPAPLSRRLLATVRCKRCASPKMLGILAILQK